MQQDRTYAYEGSIEKFQSIATASLFRVSINYDDVDLSDDVIAELAALQTDEDVYNYIKWFGTHFVHEAEMGARFE